MCWRDRPPTRREPDARGGSDHRDETGKSRFVLVGRHSSVASRPSCRHYGESSRACRIFPWRGFARPLTPWGARARFRPQVVRSVDQYISRLAINQASLELTPTWESEWFPV